ncbi:hypothetical protein [Pseudomonas sp.]|uniref:hypothetical protein n=1 Tax=Pseudomonas sp. TaxID=306 RepID=UPI0037CB778E
MSLRRAVGLALGMFVSSLLAAGERLALDTRTPYQMSALNTPAWQAADELLVFGHNPHKRAITLVLRLDDVQSDAYPSRFNREWRLPPGAFSLALPLRGLRSNDGRLLRRQALSRLFLFVEYGAPALHLQALELASLSLPASLLAWDFGSADGPCQSGFRCVEPTDPSLRGAALEARQRPYADALLGAGIRGIEQLHLPLTAGRWRVRLWREDPGEWEYLAHPLLRQVHAGQQLLLDERLSPRQWYAQRYLAGRNREWQAGTDAWQSLGQWRGEPFEFDTTVAAQGLTLDFAGDGSDARYLAAVLAWPLDGADAAAAVAAVQSLDAYRAARFVQAWPVSAPALPAPVAQLSLQRSAVDDWLAPEPSLAPLRSAGGGQLHLSLRIDSAVDDDAPLLLIQPPQQGDHSLQLQVRYGHWRLQRPQAAASLLQAGAGHLRADLNSMRIRRELPRRLVLTVSVPAGSPAGIYRGQVQLASGGAFAQYPFSVEVLATSLAEPAQGVGLYLEDLPLAGWFAELANSQAAQQRCDWQTLRSLGLNRIAPALATPSNPYELLNLQSQLVALQEAGFPGPHLAYAPLKRLRAGLGDAPSQVQLGVVQAHLTAAGAPAVWWALADEPPLESLPALRAFAASLRQTPGVLLAGQLNHPAQAHLLPVLDVALVNPGYGADQADIQTLQAAGKQAWFYNLGHERIAAGFYLWRSGASGLLQWHARMPTADPFDPTDGREADFNYLWPEPLSSDPQGPCAAQDIDERLLQLSQGIEDLRWLTWLDQQAPVNPAAAKLRGQLWAKVPSRWRAAEQLDETQLEGWRAAMLELAQALQGSLGQTPLPATP